MRILYEHVRVVLVKFAFFSNLMDQMSSVYIFLSDGLFFRSNNWITEVIICLRLKMIVESFQQFLRVVFTKFEAFYVKNIVVDVVLNLRESPKATTIYIIKLHC